MNVLARVRRFIQRHDLIRPETRVLAAVSGGSDSVALAHLLRELDTAGELRLAGLAHFNHRLRASADADERFVRELASSLGVRVTTGSGDVAGRRQRERRSLEDAARASRYEFFEDACDRVGADVVAVGHTRDDQAETFLLRLVRGAGPRGLAAIYPRRGRIVRPLLDCRRHELREWLAERDAQFVDDPSNADVSIPRNRVRAELIPFLESRFNPAIVDALATEADLAREAWEIVDTIADQMSAQIVKVNENGRIIDVDALGGVPMAMRRVLLWRAMSAMAGARPVGFHHVHDALRLLDDPRSGVYDAPGHRLERIGSSLVLTTRSGRSGGRVRANAANFFWFPLSIPGEVQLAVAGGVVSAEMIPWRGNASASRLHGCAITGTGTTAIVRSEGWTGRLAVRNRRPGDRFRPIGVGGRKKLQDVFVDRKVRRADRDLVPIVVDDSDRIVWVAGHGIDEAFRVSDGAQAVLLLRLRPL